MEGETYFIIALLFLFFVIIPAFVARRKYYRKGKYIIDPEEAKKREFLKELQNEYKKHVPQQGFKPKKTRRFNHGHISYGHLGSGYHCWFSV